MKDTPRDASHRSHFPNPASAIRLLGRAVGAASKKRGKAPGTLIVSAKERVEPARLRYFMYNAETLLEGEVQSLDELPELDGLLWLNLDGVHDLDLVRSIAERFELHPLLVEDLVSVGQRPKVEDYDPYLFVVLHSLRASHHGFEVDDEQVAFVLGDGVLLTFQEQTGDVFDPVRERARKGSGRLRTRGADYLCYALIDAVVDNYFVVLEELGDVTEAVDTELALSPGPETIRQIHSLKREILLFRKSVWPVREVMASLARSESPLLRDETKLFLRDVYDHAIHVIDTTESVRDVVSGMIDLYLSLVGQRTNEVMKVLTIMASVFIPLTFLAGIYGMNFQHMPELAWPWGYPVLLGVMVVITAGLLTYFRRKDWL